MKTEQNTTKVYLPTSQIYKTDNYPYGRLKCTAMFSIEFKPGKGFRSVFQTINPKTGRLNAPKKGTYYDIMLIYTNTENGHAHFSGWNVQGETDINKISSFMAQHFNLFTKDQIDWVYICIINSLKITAKAMVIYSGAELEQIKPIITPVIEMVFNGLKNKLNVFNDINLDIESLNKCKNPDFQPFKVTSYQIIG